MQKNIRNVGETGQELEIILTAEEFGPEFEKEMEEARRSINIKGFRKGHVPAGMVRRLAGSSIEASVAEKMASKYFSAIADEENIKPASKASIENFTFAGDTLTILVSYEIHPEFELKDLSAYTFTQADYTVTDEDVEREINLVLKNNATLKSFDGAAEEKDTVVGNVARVDAEGEPIEGKVNNNHHFNLEYLPADNPFRMALLGSTAGDTVEVTVEPKTEDEEQDADNAEPKNYRVDVMEIKRIELPELTDELVSELTHEKFDNAADFRSDVRLQLEQHFSNKSEEDLLESISEKLIEEHPVPTPKAMVDSFQEILLENAKRDVGGRLPKGLDLNEFRHVMRPNAEKHARWLLISQKVAQVNNLTVTDEDIRAHAEKEASKGGTEKAQELFSAFMSTQFRDYIVDTILKNKVYAAIMKQVTITKEPTSLPVREM